MGNLSDVTLTGRIYKLHEDKPQRKSKRLGGSLIGEKCERRIWYSFRHADVESFSGRMLRVFESGHIGEERIIKELEALGFTITDAQAIYTACKGHFVDKPDGVVDGKKSLEIKTMNDRSFKNLIKNGIPDKHMTQLQLHMRLGGYEKGLYIAENKNDEQLYIETVALKKSISDSALQKAQRIIDSLSPPERIGKLDSFVCKMCPFTDVCHNDKPMVKNCRTCKHSLPVADGKWYCQNYERPIIDTDDGASCKGYGAIDAT